MCLAAKVDDFVRSPVHTMMYLDTYGDSVSWFGIGIVLDRL